MFDPAADHSVRWHRAYGPARQVEVLRDALLHLFEETDADGQPRFEARDVAVLCPDPSRFAPLIEAVFAGDDHHGVPAIPVRVADRSLRQDNPVLDTAAALLDLLEGRFRASSVIAFASRPPVRLRFGFDADSLTRISEWAETTNVRWGLGPDDHEAFGLPADLDVHTWRAGLDQLLVGSTMAAAGPRLGPGEVALHPVVEGSDVAVAGALAELVDRLDLAVAPPPLRRARSTPGARRWPTRWSTCARCPTPRPGSGGRSSALLEELRSEASIDGVPRTTEVDPGDLSVLRAGPARRRRRPAPLRHRCRHRVVAHRPARRAPPGHLPARPRRRHRLGQPPRLGGPRRRACRAWATATPAASSGPSSSTPCSPPASASCVFSTGHDIRTNAALPPIVPVAELLDLVDGIGPRSTTPPSRPAGRSPSTTPARPGRNRRLIPRRLGTDGPWSFDLGALAAAQARRATRVGVVEFLDAPAGAGRRPPSASCPTSRSTS